MLPPSNFDINSIKPITMKTGDIFFNNKLNPQRQPNISAFRKRYYQKSTFLSQISGIQHFFHFSDVKMDKNC